MADALDRTVIDGIQHNQPFLSALMAHSRWREGRLSTSFIPEEFPGGFKGIAPAPDFLRRLALIALSIELRRRERFTRLDGHINGEGHELAQGMDRRHRRRAVGDDRCRRRGGCNGLAPR